MTCRFRIAASLLCLTLGACAATPQSRSEATLGELTAKGARKLTGVEVRRLVSGSRMSGEAWTVRGQFTSTMAPDGTYQGVSAGGHKFSGVWAVTEDGRSCSYFRDAPPVTGSPPCTVTYELNGRYFAAEGDEPTSRVRERKFAR